MTDFAALREALTAKGYQISEFDTKEEAAAYLNGRIDGCTVGFGGSVTLHEMGLFPLLAAHNTVYWHDEKPEGMTIAETRRKASQAEVYLCSVNAVSAQGDIVNIDGTGNRLAALNYGPRQVFLVIGENKLAPDLEGAVFRARNIAAPRNAQRLKRNTPCARCADRCYDCKSADRICKSLNILWQKPLGAVFEAVLIHEDLGY